MDQVRVILKLLWRERFWVLSVVGILVAVICWQMSSGALDSEYATRKGTIETKFKEMRDLNSEQNHPNDKVNAGNREQAKKQSKNVLAVWQELYDRQRKQVLFWPKDNLKPQFIEAIEKLKFRDPFPVQLADDMRNHYWNYIGNRFDGLLKIVKARKSEGRSSSFSSGGERGGRGDSEGYESRRPTVTSTTGEPIDEDYLVEWLDQAIVRDKLQFASKPSAVQIWVTQEDIWVYETLLNVIAKTNEERGATRPDNTAVRVIENLEVGRAAAVANRQKGYIIIPRAAATGEGGEGSERSYEGGDSTSESYSERGEGGGEGGVASDDVVLANRYLDPEGNPYPSGPEDKEYRRLPIRMRLLMDQRYLPQLLVECANAALPVEVKQVRVNPEASGVGFGGASGRSSNRGRSSVLAEIGSDPNLVEVEIRGVVYIYNQPDEAIFQQLVGEEDQLAEATASE